MLSADNAAFLTLFVVLVSAGLPVEHKDVLAEKIEEIYKTFLDYFLAQLKEDGRSYKHLIDPSRKAGDFTYVVDGQRKDPKTGKMIEGSSAINVFFRHHQYDGVTIKDKHQYFKVQNKLALLFINGEVDNVKLSDVFAKGKSLKHMISERLAEICRESSGYKFEVCNGATPHILGIKTVTVPVVSGGGAGAPPKASKPMSSPTTPTSAKSGGGSSAKALSLSERLAAVEEVAKYASFPDDVLAMMHSHGLLPSRVATLFGM
jgi:hypothetical protein